MTATYPGDSGGPLLVKNNGRYEVVGVVNGEMTTKSNGVKKNTLTWAPTSSHCGDLKRVLRQ